MQSNQKYLHSTTPQTFRMYGQHYYNVFQQTVAEGWQMTCSLSRFGSLVTFVYEPGSASSSDDFQSDNYLDAYEFIAGRVAVGPFPMECTQ